MKNLVLGALLVAAASSAGCTSSSDVTVTASWSFKHISDGTARSCPTDFGFAVIFAQPFDRATARANGNEISASVVPCSAGAATIVVPDGVYLMSVRIQNAGGTAYSQTEEQVFVDTAVDDGFDVEILDDGGYFFFTWDLVDAQSHGTMSCSQAGVTSAGSVEVTSTLVSGTVAADDKFTCEDHYGTTDGLPAGTYTVSLDAEMNGALGEPVKLLNKVITAPNGTTDLGHVLIPID